MNLCYILNHNAGLPAAAIYREIIDTQRCELALSGKRRCALGDLRYEWTSHIDEGETPPSDAPARARNEYSEGRIRSLMRSGSRSLWRI